MLGIICGLESEAKIARQITGATVYASAAIPDDARALAQQLVRGGATRIISFGIAGALDPMLTLGSVVIGTQVASLRGVWACDAVWAEKISGLWPKAQLGTVWGSEVLVTTKAEKADLNTTHHAAIVDMESQAVAEVAYGANIPFGVVRAVCDTAHMDVPDLVMRVFDAKGGINPVKVAMEIARNPRSIPDLIHVGRGTAAALKALRHAPSVVK